MSKIKNEPVLRQEQYMNKVFGAINELDDTIIVLKYL